MGFVAVNGVHGTANCFDVSGHLWFLAVARELLFRKVVSGIGSESAMQFSRNSELCVAVCVCGRE